MKRWMIFGMVLFLAGVGAFSKTARAQGAFEEKKDKNTLAVFDVRVKGLQIALNDEHLQGVDWAGIVADYQKVDMASRYGGALDRQVFAEHLSVGTLTKEDLDVLLEALDTVGDKRILLDVEKTVSEGKQLSFMIDDIYSYFTDDESIKAVQKAKTDKIYLRILPRLDREGKRVEVSCYVQLGGLSLPSDEIRVQVDPGGVVVLGGVFTDVQVSYTRKIPLLGDIPFLGVVFRNQAKRQRPSEIMMFVTTAVKDSSLD